MNNSKIMLVEDETLLRMSLELNLRWSGVPALSAKGGQEALHLLQEQPCELLITDYLMEELTGVELLHQARELLPDIKVIVMSGFTGEGLKQEILQAGADKFMLKPVTLEKLLLAIDELATA